LRATLYLRGIKLPPRKSLAEAILMECLMRERTEQYIREEIQMLAVLAGAPKEVMLTNFHKDVDNLLRKHVFRSAYNVHAIREERNKLRAMLDAVNKL